MCRADRRVGPAPIPLVLAALLALACGTLEPEAAKAQETITPQILLVEFNSGAPITDPNPTVAGRILLAVNFGAITSDEATFEAEFTADDITLTGGSLGGRLNSESNIWVRRAGLANVWVIVDDDAAELVVSIAADAISEGNEAATRTFDATAALSATITTSATEPVRSGFDATLTWSESVRYAAGNIETVFGVFDSTEDIDAGNASVTASRRAGSNTVWDLSVQPRSDTRGPLRITIPAGKVGATANPRNLNRKVEFEIQIDTRFPRASDTTVTAREDTRYAFSVADFAFSGFTLVSVKVTELPRRGTLELNGSLVTANQSVPKADIEGGRLTFMAEANERGTDYAELRFRVHDDMRESAKSYRMAIDVTPVNDPATGKPTISGVPRHLGEPLTAVTTGIVDPDGVPARFSYQWVRVDGGTETPLVGSDSARYTLVSADQNKGIKVRVSFTDTDGSPEGPLTSATRPVPELLPPLCRAPNLKGRLQVWSAKLTVGQVSESGNVVRHGFTQTVGDLSERNFSFGPNNYSIREITQWVTPGEKALEFELDGTLTEYERANLKLHVCAHEFALSKAAKREGGGTTVYSWPDSVLDWSETPTRRLVLSALGAPLEERLSAGDCRDLTSRGPSCGIGSSIDRRAGGYSDRGVIQTSSDADLWSVILERGETYLVEVKGSGDPGGDNGGTLADPSVEIYEFDWSRATGWSGTKRASNDNVNGANKNARVVYTYPNLDKAQTPIGIRVMGANAATGSYTVSVARGFQTLPLTETTDCASDQSTACTIEAGGIERGTLSSMSDVDAWAIPLEEGKTYQFDARGVDSGGGTLPDPRLKLNVVSGGTLFTAAADHNDGTGKDARIVRTIQAGQDSTYYVQVLPRSGTSGGTYTLTVRDSSPPLVPPGIPQVLMAAPGDGEVMLSWLAPLALGGGPLEGYEYRHGAGTSVPSGETAWVSVGNVFVENDGDRPRQRHGLCVRGTRGKRRRRGQRRHDHRHWVRVGPGAMSAEEDGAPLTVEFAATPYDHDGATPFNVDVSFSDTISTNAEQMRASVEVTGGSATGAERRDVAKPAWCAPWTARPTSSTCSSSNAPTPRTSSCWCVRRSTASSPKTPRPRETRSCGASLTRCATPRRAAPAPSRSVG